MMSDEHKETLTNLRIEYQEIIQTMRHTDINMLGFATFLIPITTLGFTFKELNKYLWWIGGGSIIIWALFWIVIISINKKLNRLKIFLKDEIETKLNKLTLMSDEEWFLPDHDMILANKYLLHGKWYDPSYITWVLGPISFIICCLWIQELIPSLSWIFYKINIILKSYECEIF